MYLGRQCGGICYFKRSISANMLGGSRTLARIITTLAENVLTIRPSHFSAPSEKSTIDKFLIDAYGFPIACMVGCEVRRRLVPE